VINYLVDSKARADINDIANQVGVVKYLKYNFDNGGLDQYFTAYNALKAGGTGVYNISFVGDSAGEGMYASSNYDYHYDTSNNHMEAIFNGYVGLLNGSYINKFDNTGLGYIPVFAPYEMTNIWKFTGSWSSYADEGISGANKMSGANGDIAKFRFHGTGVRIVVGKSPLSGTFEAKIDGTVIGTFSCYNGTAIPAAEIEIAAEGTLANKHHVLTITVNDAINPYILLHGGYSLNGATKGFRMIRACRLLATAESHAVETSMQTSINIWQPKLTIIALLANELYYQKTQESFETALQTLVTRAKTYGDVLLYAYFPRGGDFQAEDNLPYIETMKAVSDENNVPMIDLVTPYMDRMFELGCLSPVDLDHPNDRGFRLMYEPLRRELLP
jgi:lysophospholipase L1-like esterase